MLLMLAGCAPPVSDQSNTLEEDAAELSARTNAAVDRKIEELGPVELWLPNEAAGADTNSD